MKRAEAAGCPVLVLTVDLQGGFQPRDGRARAATRHARLLVMHTVDPFDTTGALPNRAMFKASTSRR